jgi:hypothetical protein
MPKKLSMKSQAALWHAYGCEWAMRRVATSDASAAAKRAIFAALTRSCDLLDAQLWGGRRKSWTKRKG